MDDLGVALILLFLSSNAHAEEVFFGYGLGVFNSARNASTEVKTVNLGYRYELYNGLYWQSKVGFWNDTSGDQGRSGSVYFSMGPSIKMDLKPVEMRMGIGLAAITSPDSYLGGAFPQFNEELYVGVRDHNGIGMGVKYEHISSGGIRTPNEGRDFILLELSTKW